MTKDRIAPDRCTAMPEVRYGVDRLDEEIVTLMGERFRYMDAAARIKPNREAVRDEVRKAQVLENVQRIAEEAGVPLHIITEVYERLVEGSISYEFDRFDAARA